MNIVRRMLIVTLLLAGALAARGQEGLILEVTGTVETKAAGSAVWVPARRDGQRRQGGVTRDGIRPPGASGGHRASWLKFL